MNYIERKTGVSLDTVCSRCGITAEDSFKLGPVETGINHPEYCQTFSFYFSQTTMKHMCPRCHREEALEKLFRVMDAREKKG